MKLNIQGFKKNLLLAFCHREDVLLDEKKQFAIGYLLFDTKDW